MKISTPKVVEVETKVNGKRLSLKLTEMGNYCLYSERTAGVVIVTAEEMRLIVEEMYPATRMTIAPLLNITKLATNGNFKIIERAKRHEKIHQPVP